MRSGQLRHQLNIQRPTSDRGSTGQRKPGVFESVAWTNGSVEVLSGREAERAAVLTPRASLKVRMRYRDDIDTTMRIVHGKRQLNIEAVMDIDGRSRELQVLCSEAM